jgi:K+:H+ antiporter subunit KhtU
MHDVVLVELGAVILGLGLLAAVASRAGIPPIPLYLVAGLCLGQGGLLPLEASSEFISTGAELGIILLLFTLGLEYTSQELSDTLRSSALVGLLDLLVNCLPGLIAGFVLGWGPVAAVVLAGVTYMSSSGIAAKVIRDLQWLPNTEVPVVLALLVFEDLVMAVYLPIVTALLAGVGLLHGSLTVAIAVATVGVILFLAQRFGHVIERLLHSPNDEVLLLKILGLTLLVGGLAEQAQVSAAVGAFLVGIAISGPLAPVARERLGGLRDLFAAVFFLFFGLQTDPSTLRDVAGIAAVLIATGVLTKFATGWIAAHLVSLDVDHCIRAGAALVPRGEFSIIIAGLALGAGLEPRLGPLVACYTLGLAVLGPLIARLVDRRWPALS